MALIPLLGLPGVHTKPSRKRNFKETLCKPNLKTLTFRFSVDGKLILKTELFENDDVTIMI